jgi:hypothetical protein
MQDQSMNKALTLTGSQAMTRGSKNQQNKGERYTVYSVSFRVSSTEITFSLAVEA